MKRRASFGASVKRSASFSNDREVVRERDRALEEWGRAATKCEELIEELECTLSELVVVRGVNSFFIRTSKCRPKLGCS